MPGVERQMLTCCGYKFGSNFSSRFIFFTFPLSQVNHNLRQESNWFEKCKTIFTYKTYVHLSSDHLTMSFFKAVEFKMAAVSVKKLYCQLN